MKTNKKSGFTLVELIVVITILAVLWTIAFVSFRSYTSNARDAVRISDVTTMRKALELYKVSTDALPIPESPVDITYSGALVWKQWSFGTSVIQQIKRISTPPLDPTFGVEYTYSVLKNKQEYQIAGLVGTDFVQNGIITQTHAATYKPLLKGNYNGLFTKVDGATCYTIALPSAIINDTTQPELQNLWDDVLVYNAQWNVPTTYNGIANLDADTFRFKSYNPSTPNGLMIYEWCNFSCDPQNIKTFVDNLSAAYQGTSVEQKGEVWKVLFNNNITEKTNNIIDLVNNYYGVKCEHVQYNISSLLPTGTVTDQSQILQVVTNNPSVCKFDTSDVAYASMTYTFDTTGNLAHTKSYNATIGSNELFVKCADLWLVVYDEPNSISFTYSTGPVNITFADPNGSAYTCTSCF